MFKNYVQRKLERYVRNYFRKHPEVRLIVVAGSVGKTTTKTAVATLLSKQFRVRMDDGNHGTHLSTPLGILGIEYPEDSHSVWAWLRVFGAAKRRIKEPADADIIIQELTASDIGSMKQYGTYLWPTIGIVTAVTEERMETFGTIEQIAQEEMTVANFSQLALINRDDVEGRFSGFLTNQAIDTYGTTSSAEYRFEIDDFTLAGGYKGVFISPEAPEPFESQIKVVGEHSLRPIIAAVAVAQKLGMIPMAIVQGLSEIRPKPGRMNVLRGVKGSVIIDDTSSSTPIAATAALQALYALQVPQRVAVFGSMNELGAASALEHEKIGKLCDPNLLDWVITIGTEAEQHLAPAARSRGCQVKSFKSAIEAGGFAHGVLAPGGVVLVKGSIENIYAEEAVRVLLHDTTEDRFLVRQEPEWLEKKHEFFNGIVG